MAQKHHTILAMAWKQSKQRCFVKWHFVNEPAIQLIVAILEDIWFYLKIGYPVPLNPVLSKKINVLKWLVVSDRHISFKYSLSVYWNGGLIGPIAKFAERTSKALSSSS